MGQGQRGGLRRAALVSGLSWVVAGCYTGLGPQAAGDTDGTAGVDDDSGSSGNGSDSGDDDPNRPPDAPTDTVPVQTVPDTLELIASTGFCKTVAPDQDVVGVSPEGFLWLAQTMPSVQGDPPIRFEVVDPWTELTQTAPVDLAFGPMVEVLPRSQDDAVVVTDDGLWHVEGWSRVQLVPPAAYAGSASACGNPRHNGAVLAGGTLFEHRSDGWWGLTPPASAGGAPTQLVTVDGECMGPADETWLTADDGTVWRVSTESNVKGLVFPELQQVVGTGATLGVLADGELWLGPDEWTRWAFDSGLPSSVAASDDQVWIAIGSRLLRALSGEFAELSHSLTGDIERVLPYPGGVWLQSGEQVCHQSVGPQFRVQGLYPYARSSGTEFPFTVVLADAGTVTATVDGESLELSPDAGTFAGVAVVAGLGWHRVDFQVDLGGATTSRTVWVRHEVPEEVSFAADIAPIAAEHCSGDTCHTAMTDNIPALETLEAWTAHADEIEKRVVMLDNMPPPGARSEAWGSDEVETIAKWIEGGMQP